MTYDQLLDKISAQLNTTPDTTPVAILIRGAQGSGKTTLAGKLSTDLHRLTHRGYYHFEADQYFMKTGEYRFNPEKLGEAHKECQEHYRTSLSSKEGRGPIVIASNTFARRAHIEPYIFYAKDTKASLFIIRLMTEHGNVHNVPADVVARVRGSMEPIEEELIVDQD